jgi:putative urate catabolism protein
MAASLYPRDLKGYAGKPPHPHWPNDARIALQFVVNFEEGGEHSILHGDDHSEVRLHEIPGIDKIQGGRNLNVESFFEYGTRAGLWRILEEFGARRLPFTAFGVGMAIERLPDAARAIVEGGNEIASHGWRWIDYQHMPKDEEAEHVRRATEAIIQATGVRPVGWYTGRIGPNTRALVMEQGGFLYDSDSYADDLPYWTEVSGKPHLIIPYTLDNNDMKFASLHGFITADHFFAYLRDSFDTLYREGATHPKMMSVGLHLRLIGRPGRFAALRRFLDYVQSFEDVWICRRDAIAHHWIEHHAPNSFTGHQQ